MIVHKNVLNSFLVNNCRLGRVDTSPPSLIFNNNNMALQVWLPLNKNGADKNQGLANVNITSTATYNASGKLGGSYDFSNSSKRISFPSQSWMAPNDTNSISIAMWVKAGSFNWIIACTAFEYKLSSSSFMWRLGNGSTNTFATTTSGITFTTGTWYHLCGTWDAKNKKLAAYVNGELVKERTSTLTSYNDISSTIDLVYGGSWNINDFRFYDHCLSLKEVKEIAKGLVLHYPLNDAACSKNLASNTDWERTSSTEYMKILDSYQDAGTGEYTFSCEMKVAAGTPNVYIYSTDGDYTSKYTYSVSDIYTNGVLDGKLSQQWQKIVCKLTFTVSAEDSTIMPHISTYYKYGSGAIVSVRNPKLEKGWNPNPIYTNSLYNTVYDCSGYQNNGTISGSLSCSADSPRYNKSCKFGSGIIGTTSGFASAQSYTFWANVVDKTAQTVFVDGASKLGFGMFSTYFICSSAGKTSAKYSTANLTIGWHHFAVVNDLLYIDGVLQEKPSGTDTWVYSGSMLEIGNRSNGNSYPWKGQISDFRVYATALSSEDIKELYNTSCIINS